MNEQHRGTYDRDDTAWNEVSRLQKENERLRALVQRLVEADDGDDVWGEARSLLADIEQQGERAQS